MARIRNIKPEFFLSEEIAALPMEARLAFIGLWTQADCNGRLADRPMRLKVAIFPYDPKVDMEKILCALADGGLITRYENGGKYIEINTFRKHQAISNRERDIGSEIPAPSKEEPKQVPVQDQASTGTGSVQDRSDDIGLRTKDEGHRTKDADIPAAGGGDTPQTILSEWNAVAKIDGVRLEEATKLTDKRRASAKERLTDPYFRENWRQALQRIREDKFYQGCGERGWVAGLDYFLRPDTVAKVMERKRGGIMAYPDGVFVGDFDGFEDGNTANISARNGAGEKNTGEAISRPQDETKTAYKPISGATVAA